MDLPHPDPGTPAGPGRAGPRTKTIRVVDAKRPLVDITLLGTEELRSILEPLVLDFDPSERQAILGLEQIVEDLRALRDRDPAGGATLSEGPQTWSGAAQGATAMDEVAARQMLFSEAVRPVVTEESLRGGQAPPSDQRGEPPPGSIRARAGVRKAVYVPDTLPGRRGKLRSAAVAAEQAVVVEGFVLDPRLQGGVILDVLAGGLAPEPRAVVATGAYTGATLSVLLARETPSDGPLRDAPLPTAARGGLRVTPYSPEAVRALARQLGGALAFHLSGAGAVLALGAAARAAKARRAAPPSGAPSGIAGSIVAMPTLGVTLPTREALEYLVGRIAEVFPGVVAVPDSFVFALTPLLDIYRVGAFGVYYSVLAEGRGSLAARRYLEQAAAALAERRQVEVLGREVFAETARARHYIIIAEDKFGAGRVGAIEDALALVGPTAADDPEAILAQLQKREREVVVTEYANRLHEWSEQAGNKCPHVRLAYRLRAARTARESTKLLKELAAYFARSRPAARAARGPPAKGDESWIHCKSCGFRVICPHVVELLQMQARNEPFDAIRTRLMKFKVQGADRSARRDGTSAVGGATYGYFCRICSERLSEFVSEDRTAEVLGAVGRLDDYVRKVIWVEAVNAADLVRFPVPVDPRQFASTAVDVCYPLILEAEAALLKRGRRAAKARPRGGADNDPYGDEDSVDPRTHLYIALFVYAYILNLIRSSHSASEEANRRLGFEGVRAGAKMSAYASGILSSILGKYSALIARIEDVTPEFIADRFREAYRLVTGIEGPQELTSADEAKLMVNEIVTLSPVYHYAAIAARVYGPLGTERPLTPPAAKKEFETVFGRPLPAILADRAADSKSELVRLLLGIRPTGRGFRRVAVAYPRGSDPLYVYGEPEVNFLADIFRVPAAAAKRVDRTAFDALGAFAEAIPACGNQCVAEAVGGRAAPGRMPKAKRKGSPKKSDAKRKGQRPAPAGAEGSPRPGKRLRFDPRAFLRGDATLSAASSGLFLRSYELFAEYTTEITSAGEMAAYQERLAEARSRERGYLLYRSALAVKNYRQFGFTMSRRFGLFEDPRAAGRRAARLPGMVPRVALTYLYDENGLPHSWAPGGPSGSNIYVYSAAPDAAPDTVELTLSEIRKGLAEARSEGGEGPIHGRSLVDVKCSVCGVLLSQTSSLDGDKVRESMRALVEFSGFFSFYDSRCPVDGLHEFPERGGACSKCGIVDALIFGHGQAKNASSARAYYGKFLERYREQRGVVTGVESRASDGAAPLLSHVLTDAAADALEAHEAFASGWKHDYGLLVGAAELIGEPVAALETIGATGGREYADVLSGTDAPPPPTTTEDPRILAADSDVRVFITAYNRLRFANRFLKLDPAIEEILLAAEVPRHEYEGLPATLPDIFDGYASKRLAIVQVREPADALTFSIESLARMALAAAASSGAGKPWVARLGKEFATRTLRGIIRSERLLAKNGPFNFNIFGDEDAMAHQDGAGDFAGSEFGAAGEDVLDDIVSRGGEDGAADAFSLEGVDLSAEDASNLEPG